MDKFEMHRDKYTDRISAIISKAEEAIIQLDDTIDESFIVARTKRNEVALHMPTEDERAVVKELRWFSLAR